MNTFVSKNKAAQLSRCLVFLCSESNTIVYVLTEGGVQSGLLADACAVVHWCYLPF